jgi:hypothetical protein
MHVGRRVATVKTPAGGVCLPLLMRALMGEKLKPLRAEIGAHVARSVAIFLAACRHGGVN